MEVGETATFTVLASGGRLGYQWIGPGGQPLSNQLGEIEGSNNAILHILNSGPNSIGSYQASVSNSHGFATSDSVLLKLSKYFMCSFRTLLGSKLLYVGSLYTLCTQDMSVHHLISQKMDMYPFLTVLPRSVVIQITNY